MRLYQHLEHLWAYMRLNQPLERCDGLLVLGSNDVRVAEHAAKLYLDGWAKTVIFSGGAGRLTQGLFTDSEADTFAQIAIDMGVPRRDIVIENQATNTGENLLFSAEKLQQLNIQLDSILLVQKQYMERRCYAAFLKQWPLPYRQVFVTSPALTVWDYFNEDIDLDTTVRAMLGDFERIKTYPQLGFQVEQVVPDSVEQAYRALKAIFD
ncbi:YdcF family protein [Vibrio cholerae]